MPCGCVSPVVWPCGQADVSLTLEPWRHSVRVESEVVTSGQTGVEMEALTAAGVAALTVYDMCKAVASRDMQVTDLRLDHKAGGRSGDFTREGHGHGQGAGPTPSPGEQPGA